MTLARTIKFWNIRDKLHMWHAHSTNETLSKDSKVDDLVILTVTFVLEITDLDFVATSGIHVSQTH